MNIIFLILIAIGAIIAITWIVLPFLLISRMDRMIQMLESIDGRLYRLEGAVMEMLTPKA